MSYYALFKGWLLLSQPPGCLGNPTSLPTKLTLGTLADGLGCFPFDNGAYPPLSHCRDLTLLAFAVWLGSVSSRPLTHPELYLQKETPDAAPQCISGRTSYLRVRLAFHLYPQLIPELCTALEFGPPVRFSEPSPWPWIAHSVSGLFPATRALFRLAFASAPEPLIP